MKSTIKHLVILLLFVLLLLPTAGSLQAAEKVKGDSSNYVAHQLLVRFTADIPEEKKVRSGRQ